MATFYGQIMTPQEFIKAADTSTDIIVFVKSSAPDGNSSPHSDAAKGSIQIRDDQSDDQSPLFVKVDAGGDNDDWVAVIVDKDEAARQMEANWTWTEGNRIYFRDTGISIYSNADGEVTITADGQINIGDGTNQVEIQADGEIQLAGTAQVIRAVPLPLDTQHGTADSEAFNAAPSINLDTDGETWYFAFEAPNGWNEVGDLTLVFMVGNEIAEDDGDDVSITCQVRGYADGETMSDAGQSVAATLNLTGGDEGQDVINRVTATIDYDDGTYPIAAGDTVVVECTINLGGAGECTGPLHVVAQWVEYTANKLGTAT